MPTLTCLNKGRVTCGPRFRKPKLYPGDTLEITEDDIPFFQNVIDRGYASVSDDADGGAANSGTATPAPPSKSATGHEKKNKKRKKYRKRKSK